MNQPMLEAIWIYPIKSLGGISVKKARVLEKGLEHDRRWMLIDEANTFMTQRHHPLLARFSVIIENDHLHITHKKTGNSHSVPINPPAYPLLIKAALWRDVVDVMEVSDSASDWFTQETGVSCRLVYFPEQNERVLDKNYVAEPMNASLADGYPFLVIGQSSLDDLNRRMKKPLPMNRFRPNFVVSGTVPYAEDEWQNFSIGNVNFRGVKNCSRCTLTTVDQDSGKKGSEPLTTLATYRKRGNEVYFGQNVIATNHGMIQVGNRVTIMEISESGH